MCNRSETEFPLVVLQFNNKKLHICPQCLPVLIHKPEQVEEKLKKH